jgi:hypothetical protein
MPGITKSGHPFVWKKLVAELAAKGAHDPEALAAWIGRRVLGKAQFQALSKGHRHRGG